jgi:glutamate synthase (NADPH/NADH) small chain
MTRAAVERVHDWHEFVEPLPNVSVQKHAMRCLDCGVPFCHSGIVIAGSTSGCPLNNLIPEWNQLVANGAWYEAFKSLDSTNNFPEFTSRVCPAPCQGACVAGINDQPVAIKSIEHAIIERAFSDGWITARTPARSSGKRVAVVGSGPAGLACADQLNQLGHEVTVFERADRVGGLLVYGIPNMKLDKSIVQRRLDLLKQEGINFLVNTEVGVNYATEQLIDEFDATVLCGGATKPRDLNLPNRSLEGIHFAMDFLRDSTKQLFDEDFVAPISARDKDVIVIGGGDTGTDCIATALRQGCRSLVQFEILPQQPESRSSDNPWPQWPRVHRVDYGHEETIAVKGSDPRSYCIQAIRFEGSNKVEAVITVDVSWEPGRPFAIESTERRWPAQLVLLALGFEGPEKTGLLTELNIDLTSRGTVAVDHRRMTNVPGVFAAGDMERGQSLVVWAMADGRHAAASINKYLTASL